MILLFAPFALFSSGHAGPDARCFAPTTIAIAADRWSGRASVLAEFRLDMAYRGGPVSWSDRFAAFWFDTTKTDWREYDGDGGGTTDSPTAPGCGLRCAPAVWLIGLTIAILGRLVCGGYAVRGRLWSCSPTQSTRCFAFTYNIGDTIFSTEPSLHRVPRRGGDGHIERSEDRPDCGARRSMGLWSAAAILVIRTPAGARWTHGP